MRITQRLMAALALPALVALTACQPIQMTEEMMGDDVTAEATAAPAEEEEAAPADDAMAEETVLDEESAIATIATRSLRVRQEPSEEAEVVYGVSEGEQYNVLGISPDGGWVQLAIADAPGGSGWVAAGLVVVEGELTGGAPAEAAEATDAPAEEATAEPAAEATEAPAEEATAEPAAEATDAPAEEATAEPAAEATEAPAEEATAEPAAEATDAPQEELAPPAAGFVQVATDGTRLRVRSEPNTDAEIVGYVYNGEEYELLEQSEDGTWVQIAGSTAEETDNPDGGWVAAEFVIIGQ